MEDITVKQHRFDSVYLHNLPKPRWRDALRALAAPAKRVHEYRNLHKTAFYRAMCAADCREDE